MGKKRVWVSFKDIIISNHIKRKGQTGPLIELVWKFSVTLYLPLRESGTSCGILSALCWGRTAAMLVDQAGIWGWVGGSMSRSGAEGGRWGGGGGGATVIEMHQSAG